MKVCIISYSSRPNGNCAGIARYVSAALARKHPDWQSSVHPFPAIGNHTCGSCRYDCFGGVCPYRTDELQALYDEMLRSDMLVSIVPIYGGLPCSNYFILNERVQGAFDETGFASFDRLRNHYIVIGNTGAEIAKEIFRANDSRVTDESVLVIRSHDVGERSIRGNLITYSCFQEQIDRFTGQLR